MQKVLRRTALAKKQAERRLAARKGKNNSDERKLRDNEQTLLRKAVRDDILNARLARREDFLLGPLAPRRDVGDKKDIYGTIGSRQLKGVEKPEGQYKDWGIVAGDRVVIVQDGHRERGRIGTVREVRKAAEECIIQGMNMADVAIPNYMLVGESDKTPYRPYSAPLPLSAVRLVIPFPHSETRTLRDAVITEVKLKRVGLNELKGDEPPSRFIAGLSPAIRIPYPEKAPEEFDDNDCDTLRIEVEQKTWVPTLINAPMPFSIVDELRNKYSKFRDRHDPSWVAKKMREDEEAKERQRSVKKMMTPLKELHRKERAARKAKGKPVLSEEMMEKIGQVMARQAISNTGPASAMSIDSPS